MLHRAAILGSKEKTVVILSHGSIDINQQAEPAGCTPLMFAARGGHSPVVRVLLNKGANLSIIEFDDGSTALHFSAEEGHFAVTAMLVGAGADLEAVSKGSTPLCAAAMRGQREVMRALIAAGADPDSRAAADGETPLFAAAGKGHVLAVKELLRANADPLLTTRANQIPGGVRTVPLDTAAKHGRSDVVRELVQQVGIEGCGGSTGGEFALGAATMYGSVEIMSMLMDAGVCETACVALVHAAAGSHEGPVKFLLQKNRNVRKRTKGAEIAYVNCADNDGYTPLFASILSCSPRIGRMLLDAGADATSAVLLTTETGEVIFNDTPLAFTSYRIQKMVDKGAPEKKVQRVEATRRMLVRADSVHAVSWLWPVDIPVVTHAATEGLRSTGATSSSLTVMLPIMRRRASSRGVFLATLFRYVVA